MSNVSPGDVISLEITGVSSSGSGVARLGANPPITVFVPLTCPGDKVKARLESLDGPIVHAVLLELISPGKDRVEPVCPYFGVCGGCSVQHLSYPRQLVEKQALVSRALSSVVPEMEKIILPVIPAKSPFGSRTRGRFHVADVHQDDGSIQKLFGLKASKSDLVIDIESCPIVDPKINQALQWVRRFWLEELPHGSQIELVIDEEKSRVIASAYATVQLEHAHEASIELPDTPIPPWLSLQVGSRQEGASFYPIKGDRPLRFSPDVFSQCDFDGNRVLVQEVLKSAKAAKDSTVLDLCCGVGNFSLPLAKRVKLVEGVEGSRRSVELAKNNAVKWGCQNALFVKADVSGAIRGLARKCKTFEIGILDPPRVGLGQASSMIKDVVTKRIVYVSCDPKSLASDLGRMSDFKVVSVQPIDLFPQTMHVETVVVLEKDFSPGARAVSGMPKPRKVDKPMVRPQLKVEDL